jgi:hypothetical protein
MGRRGVRPVTQGKSRKRRIRELQERLPGWSYTSCMNLYNKCSTPEALEAAILLNGGKPLEDKPKEPA